jgi:hypothetical protein
LNDISDGHLIVNHLIESLLLGDGTEILMRPGMAGHLVAFSNHTLNDSRPGSGCIINGSFTEIVASDEESSLHIVAGKLIKYAVGKYIRAVVISDGNRTRFLTRVNTLTTILYVAKLQTRNIAGAVTVGDLVCITTRTEVDQAIRRSAIFLGISAPSLKFT